MKITSDQSNIPGAKSVLVAWGISMIAAVLLAAFEYGQIVPIAWAGGCIVLPLLWRSTHTAIRAGALAAMAGLGLFSCVAISAIVSDGRWNGRDVVALVLAVATAVAAVLTFIVTWRNRMRDRSAQSDWPTSDAARGEELPRSAQPRAPGHAELAPKIFISYRRDDSQATTDRIFEHLTSAFPRQHLFRDIDSIPKGLDFRQWIDRSVAQCNVLLAIIGPQWLSVADENGKPRLENPADFVRLELEAALRRDIPLIPVTIANGRMPKAQELPESLHELAYRNGTTVRHDPDFANDMQRLIADLRAAGHTPRDAQVPGR